MLKKLILSLLLLCSVITSQVITPKEFILLPGNGAMAIEGNYNKQMGTVIDNFPQGTYNQVSFRPNFCFYDNSQLPAVSFDVQIEMSYNTVAAQQMANSNSHSLYSTVVLPRTTVNFPAIGTQYPNKGYVPAEPWSYKFIFAVTFYNPSVSNICMTLDVYTKQINVAPFEMYLMGRGNYIAMGLSSPYLNTVCGGATLPEDMAYSTWDSINGYLLHAYPITSINGVAAGIVIGDQFVAPWSYDVAGNTCFSVLNPSTVIPVYAPTGCVIPIPTFFKNHSFATQWITADYGREYSGPVRHIYMPTVYSAANPLTSQSMSDQGLLPSSWFVIISKIE